MTNEDKNFNSFLQSEFNKRLCAELENIGPKLREKWRGKNRPIGDQPATRAEQDTTICLPDDRGGFYAPWSFVTTKAGVIYHQRRPQYEVAISNAVKKVPLDRVTGADYLHLGWQKQKFLRQQPAMAYEHLTAINSASGLMLEFRLTKAPVTVQIHLNRKLGTDFSEIRLRNFLFPNEEYLRQCVNGRMGFYSDSPTDGGFLRPGNLSVCSGVNLFEFTEPGIIVTDLAHECLSATFKMVSFTHMETVCVLPDHTTMEEMTDWSETCEPNIEAFKLLHASKDVEEVQFAMDDDPDDPRFQWTRDFEYFERITFKDYTEREENGETN